MNIKWIAKLYIYKALSALKGNCPGKFDDTTYKNKRIIIIGPASSSTNYLNGDEIDEFDIILRINKSTAIVPGMKDKIGSRTDILYHCCDENKTYGGGHILPELLKEQKNLAVLFTYYDLSVIANVYKLSYLYPKVRFCITEKELYVDLAKKYSAKMPTTGLQALNHVLAADFKELHITGFTFFKTPYAAGYRDNHQAASSATMLAKSTGNHDPDDELRIFNELYSDRVKHKKIFLDSTLSQIIEQHQVERAF